MNCAQDEGAGDGERDPQARQRLLRPGERAPEIGFRLVHELAADEFPVAVTMGHAHTAYEVLLALGNNPGTNFNITLLPTFGARGLGSLCLPEVAFDEDVVGVKLTDGMNATLQVQSNGDPTGGLYAVCLVCLLLESDSPHCIP